MLQRDQLAVERLVGFGLGLGVERPALDVDAVEREEAARERHAALDHRGELQVVAGTAFVRGERPRAGLVREVVERRRLAAGAGVARGQDKHALFTLRADERRGLEVRRGLRGVLGVGGDAHPQRAVGERHDFFAADDFLNPADDLVVVRLDLGLGELGLLQFPDDGAVIGIREAVFLRDQRRERLHLVAVFAERELGLLNQVLRRDIEADVLEVVGIKFGGQAGVRARLGQDGAAEPRRVILELGVERIEGGRSAVEFVDPVFGVELPDAGGVLRDRGEMVFDLALERREQRGVAGAFIVTVLGELGNRLGAGHETGVTLQAHERGGPAGGFDLVVEQAELAEENQLRHVGVGEGELFVERGAGQTVVGGLDQDIEVLLHARIGLGEGALDELIARRGRQRACALVRARGEVGDLLIEAPQADAPREFRRHLGRRIEQHLGIQITLRDPLRLVGGRRARDHQDRQPGDPATAKQGTDPT